MNSLKNHFALIIPLVALLFSLESILLVDRTLKDYESKLGNSYALILASSKTLTLTQVKNLVIEAQELSPIDPQLVLNKLEKNISQANFALLKNSLPFFYSLKLSRYPSSSRLEVIEKNLNTLQGIMRVESFQKTHSQIYQLLLIINGSIIIFSCLIALISMLLMLKQIEIWKFEHHERMEIMALLGAPLWMRSELLFRLACIDTIIATCLVMGGLVYIAQDENLLGFMQDLGINPQILSPLSDSIILLCVGLLVSLVSVWIVSVKYKDQP